MLTPKQNRHELAYVFIWLVWPQTMTYMFQAIWSTSGLSLLYPDKITRNLLVCQKLIININGGQWNDTISNKYIFVWDQDEQSDMRTFSHICLQMELQVVLYSNDNLTTLDRANHAVYTPLGRTLGFFFPESFWTGSKPILNYHKSI